MTQLNWKYFTESKEGSLKKIIVSISPKGSSLDMQICLQFDPSKGLENLASRYFPAEAVNNYK
jgi:hypothetical protein